MSLVLIDNTDPAIVQITLNRPEKRNALSIELMRELTAAMTQATGARVLILNANGPVFCAGLDLTEAADTSKTHDSSHALAELYKTLATSPLITIAAAQGSAIGGGVGLLAACDFVIAADDLKVGFPEVRRGLVAALVTALLYRQLPSRAMRELILLGQTIDSAHAMSLGLVNRLAPADELMNHVRELSKQAIAGAPGAIARSKLLLDDLDSLPISTALDRALQYHLAARDATEAAEGIAAFLEKREPRWGAPSARPD